MMSRLCLLLAIVFCLPLACLGGGGLVCPCLDEDFTNAGLERPAEGITNYRAYTYTGQLDTDCNNLMQTCEATILPTDKLRGRTWFLTNIKPNFGFYYDNQTIHDFKVQCPNDTYLHLYVQESSLPITAGICFGDRVRIQATGIDELVCGNNEDVRQFNADLYNFGRGIVIPDGRANVSFCSDNVVDLGGPFSGFVIRATCLDPATFLLPGCVDFPFFREWDPDFVNLIFNEPISEPERIILPHKKKRSVSDTLDVKKVLRNKRFSEVIDLEAGDMVTFNNRELTIIKNATGEVDTRPRVETLFAYTPLIETREFMQSAPFTFFGPGQVFVDKGIAFLSYTLTEDMIANMFLPGIPEAEAANIIFRYIYDNWINPYPVVNNVERRLGALPILPLPPGNMPPRFPDLDIVGYRPVNQLGFVQEDIQSGNDTGNCMRAIRIEVAPSNKDRVGKVALEYCQFFSNACDPVLRAACQEVLKLDPLSSGK